MNASPASATRVLSRREAIQWVLTAAASMTAFELGMNAAPPRVGLPVGPVAGGYGPDPDMVRVYRSGELWPLTFTAEQRRAATALADVIIPADDDSPSASAVGVADFLDEWVSSPYPAQAADRTLVLEGLAWIDAEAQKRFQHPFANLAEREKVSICEGIANPATAPREHAQAVKFFKRFRDLTAGGYYTTAEGMKAIGYVGNVPLPAFPGPPIEALRHVGLA